MQNEISISFIIAARANDLSYTSVVKAINELSYPKNEFEVLVSCGKNPSVQRNRAAKIAKGEYLYFLDDDSIIDALTLSNIKEFLAQNRPDVLGGPCLLSIGATPFQQTLYHILSSPVTVGPLYRRFASSGMSPKNSNEQEIILANLIIKKDFYLNFGGLNKNIYPGEENYFLINSVGLDAKIFYHPQMVVRRFPREKLNLFIKQIFNYGLGRANHISVFELKYWPFLTSLFFSLYWSAWPFIQDSFGMGIYCTYLLFSFGYFSFKQQRLALRELLLIPLMHYIYGVGILVGLIFKNLKIDFNPRINQNANVIIHNITIK